jgi:outer membrane translocation and assembly module TamA
LDSNDLNYHLEINKGPLFLYDTLHIEGERILKSNFLEAYLGIKNKSAYNESLFKKVNGKINQLPFVSSERTPLVAFIEGGLAKPYIYLKKKKADQINGIIGLAPGNSSTQAFVFTGEFLLKLNNLFKSAKSIHLNWRSFNARSQELKAQANLPYLFSKPFGLDYSLDFLKFDTLYTSVQNQIGFKYYTSGLNGIKAFYQTSITNLNSVDTVAIRLNKRLPSINSISNNRYGLEGYYNQLDYIFNPQRGWILDGQLLVGSRTLLKDNIISQVKFENQKTLYDSINLRTTQLFYKIKYDHFFKLGNSSTFKFGVYMTQIVSDNLYFNELLREGGINSLKGFNEQSIFASNFNMLDIEYRYLISKDSYFKVFWNGAYYENKQVELGNKTISDFPWGFGVGGQIETGAGILSIMYALGKEKNNPFDLRTGKIHFGISNFF